MHREETRMVWEKGITSHGGAPGSDEEVMEGTGPQVVLARVTHFVPAAGGRKTAVQIEPPALLLAAKPSLVLLYWQANFHNLLAIFPIFSPSSNP